MLNGGMMAQRKGDRYEWLRSSLYNDEIPPDNIVGAMNTFTHTEKIAELVVDVFLNKESIHFKENDSMVKYIHGLIKSDYRHRTRRLYMITKELVKYAIDNGVGLNNIPSKWLVNEDIINYGCGKFQSNVVLMYGIRIENKIENKEWLYEWRNRMVSKWLDKYPLLVCDLASEWYTYDDYITAIKKDYDAFYCSNKEYRTIDAVLYAMMGGYSGSYMVDGVGINQRDIIKYILCLE
jgi:hypothetical protein